jgi:twitching motility two-component system response regulator PilH
MRQGARAYLTKPFSEEELSEVINSNLGGGEPEPTAA